MPSLPVPFLLVLSSWPGHASVQDPPPATGSEIAGGDIEAHVRFLASDELRGRDTGSKELNRAARYLAECLRSGGVEPAGDGDGFLQAVPLVREVRETPPAMTLVDPDGVEEVVEYGADFTLLGGGVGATESLHVVVVRTEADVPAEPDPQAALYVASRYARGLDLLEAAGCESGVGFGALVFPGSSRPGRSRFRPGVGRLRLAPPSEGSAPPRVRVNGDLRARFESGRIASLTLHPNVRLDPVETYNVIGRVAGKGPDVIVFSAHYDHIGSGEAPPEGVERDVIRNGADDDASGTACVVELARAFARGPRPAHTLLFLLATGEEKGLLGTHHYLDHPPVPLERTLCNLNFEMIGRPDPEAGGAGRMWLTGHERTNLYEAFTAAGIPIGPDARPEQNFF
ncbi:MAG: M28 family peptidase, partial [Planctomycetota bacterium]|nr:M28 family peptidase [Planctomycetota bacterium]